MKLSGVMLGTEDSKVLGDFYTKIFGEPGWHDGDWYGFDVDGGMLVIGPHSEVNGKNSQPARIMIMINSNEVQADFDRMKDAGAEVVAEPYQPNAADSPNTWLATLADPDGNYFQLSTPWEE